MSEMVGEAGESANEKCAPMPSSSDFHIVGVGASAGGLEALEIFFEAMPVDSGIAFVVIQHLSPDFKSHMEELLSRRTKMQVYRVENGMEIQPNCIYLIPPKMEMVISDRRLLLTEKSRERQLSHPINQFFRSLATDIGRLSIGVVLSGTGSDGSRGVREIHDAGGLVLAQDEKTAKFDGMPLNAIATGRVDVVANPRGIAQAIKRYVRDGLTRETLAEQEMGLVAHSGMDKVFDLLRTDHGIDFTYYKASTVGRRVERRMQMGKHRNLDQYLLVLKSDREELNLLYKDLLIGVTRFFRDTEAFTRLANEIVPKIVEECPRGEAIRVWIAGCASGEEAYSVAMLFNDHIEATKRAVQLRVFATDAHQGSLAAAARGVYSEEAMSEVDPERKRKYFRKQRDGYHVCRDLRKLVLFAPHNVINDAPFTQLDLVVCRNLLIYLQPHPQKKTLSMFHFALKTGGTLFLGPSESPGDIADEFQVVDARWRIYRKRRDVRLPVDAPLPLLGNNIQLPRSAFSSKKSNASPQIDRNLLGSYDLLLNRFMPPSLLVTDSYDLVHVFGGAEQYLQFRGGRATSNVLDIVAESLKTTLSSALQHAINTNREVRYRGIDIATVQGVETVSLHVEPLFDPVSKVTNYLVRFETIQHDVDPLHSDAGHVDELAVIDPLSQDHVHSLETELRYTRENLQATIEELEASNEELQATNEELVASNEELQSTNEELHSVNEELYTVNAEHQRRVEELAQSNDDMDNLLATTRVGVIFLDQDLFIRRFTPEIARVFHLVSQDLGRSIRSFAHNLHYDSLIEDLESVLQTGVEHEQEHTDVQGKTFLARMTFYRSQSETGGVVMTLIDITRTKELQEDTRRLISILDATPDFVGILDATHQVTYLNAAAKKMFGVEDSPYPTGLTLASFHTPQSNDYLTGEALPRAKREGRWSGEVEFQTRVGRIVPMSQVIVAHRDPIGRVTHLSVVARDISKLKESQQILADSVHSLRRIIDNMLSFVGFLESDGTLLEINLTAAKAAGMEREAVIGKKFWDCDWWTHDQGEVERLKNSIRKAAAGETIRYDATIHVADDQVMDIDFMIAPVKDEMGRVLHLVPSGVDITARKQAEAQLHVRQLAIESANNGIVITDPRLDDCPLTYVNRGFTGTTGYSAEESLGKNCRFLQGPDTDPEVIATVREAVHQGIACRVTLLNYRKDGTPFWNDLQITPVHDAEGNLINFVGVLHDITDQVEGKTQAIEVAERIRALLDSTAEGIYGLNASGECTFCNSACARMLGFQRPDELIGKHIHQLIHHTRPDGSPFPEHECPIYQAFASGTRINVDAEVFWRADGSCFPVEYWSYPVLRDGEIAGAVVTFVDTTRRRQQQEELNRAREAADAASRAKSQFLANMSHELRTPMAAVMGFADIITQESKDVQVRERVSIIQRNGEYLLKLLNDILDLSRVEAGAIQLELTSCDLRECLQDLREMMQVRADESSRTLQFHFREQMPKVITTDPARLRQILVNLIGNAIKFSPQGRVDVSVGMSTIAKKTAIRFEVKDTGIGIAEEHLERLFQPFNQGDNQISKQFGGSGLGLSISKRLVDSLGGTLSVESTLGQGSTFVVELPIEPHGPLVPFSVEQLTLPMEDKDPGTTATNLRAKVLLADDMRDVRLVAMHFLEKFGCQVVTVENGYEAVEAIEAAIHQGQPYDVAVIDMQMPVMDGLHAIQRLRQKGIAIPAIALTADAMKGTKEVVLAAGFDEYLTKPISSRNLLKAVRKAMAKKMEGHATF